MQFKAFLFFFACWTSLSFAQSDEGHRPGFYLLKSPDALLPQHQCRIVFMNSTLEQGRRDAQANVVWQMTDRHGTRVLDKVIPESSLRYMGSSITTNGFLPIAHRGYCQNKVYPCNTQGAFDLAMRMGFEAIELDVQVSADGHFFVTHDERLQTSTTCRGRVSEFSAEKLHSCQVKGSNRIPEWRWPYKRSRQGQSLLSLQDVFQGMLPLHELKRLVVDVKEDSVEHILGAFAKLDFVLRNPELASKLIVISRSSDVLRGIRARWPYVQRAIEDHYGTRPYIHTRDFLKEVSAYSDVVSLSTGVEVGGETIAFGYGLFWKSVFSKKGMSRLLDDYVATAQTVTPAMPTMAWTVNNHLMFKKLWDANVEYVMTDSDYANVARLMIRDVMKHAKNRVDCSSF